LVASLEQGIRLTRLLDPVYITQVSIKLMGDHIFASCQSKLLKEMMPSFLTRDTQDMQTEDWIASRRKVIEKSLPDTTNCQRLDNVQYGLGD